MSSWALDVDKTPPNEADAWAAEASQWQRHAIYRVLAFIKKLNPKAYRPEVVSLGAFHHGAAELLPMEAHKCRALAHLLLWRSGRPLMEEFRAAMRGAAEQLESAYRDWRGADGVRDRFLEMMIIDGCFVLEVMKATKEDGKRNVSDYAPNDPIFSPMGSTRHEAGVRIKRSWTDSLRDVRFRRGVPSLSVPALCVDDSTEYLLLNMTAFERLHAGAGGSDVAAYVFLMSSVLGSARDVALLRSEGIVQNAAAGGDDKVVAQMFERMSKDAVLEPESAIVAVHRQVNAYCRRSRRPWRMCGAGARLSRRVRDECSRSTTWAILAVVLLVLLIVQTIYTALQFYTLRRR
ncbi:hypothetical protein BDA96_05G155400 [Sorghum bicolor]|uniref:Uncharacterized protein n=2 Tax=Sorghum bicolor TaxID=4558 RepID=A0A1B6PTX3_SORBI|nr:hypothetical protein BDA96_05G155400 [Sorghum bicolor]KXG29124.2 hypothetical protein SORBI_3005G142400 [Sorghum bicolor]